MNHSLSWTPVRQGQSLILCTHHPAWHKPGLSPQEIKSSKSPHFTSRASSPGCNAAPKKAGEGMNYNITHPKAWCCAPAINIQLLQLSLRRFPSREKHQVTTKPAEFLKSHTQFREKQHKLLPGLSNPSPVRNWRQPEPGRSKNWKSRSADQCWTVALALFCSWMLCWIQLTKRNYIFIAGWLKPQTAHTLCSFTAPASSPDTPGGKTAHFWHNKQLQEAARSSLKYLTLRIINSNRCS